MKISDDLNVALLDVIHFKRKSGKYVNPGRNFSALSFRIDCETTFIYKHGRVHCDKGTVCLIPSDVGYTTQCSDENLIVIHFNLCNYISDKIQCFIPNNSNEFEELFKEILQIWKEKRPGYRLLATSVLYKILSKIKREGYKSEKEKNKYGFAVDYMKSHLSDSFLSIHDIAKKLGICDSLFRREFKAQYGISAKQYLDNLRIEYAIMLIQSDYFSQTEISERCGFNDVKYFRTVFKKKTGINASKYKYTFVPIK